MQQNAIGGLMIRLTMLLSLGLLLGGCGGSSVQRVPVSGRVTTADGKPLNGSITLLPSAGTKGPAATVGVVDGKYQFDRNNGPTAGPHRVLIVREITKSLPANKPGPASVKPMPPTADLKSEWTLSTDVPAAGSEECDFKLD